MTFPPTSNVFSGQNALRDYYDPDKNPPLPLVEIPRQLNPFYDDGVHIYAKMMTFLPAHNVKELPALAMLSSSQISPQTKSLVEYSSGSTVISMGIIARVLHGIVDTRAYISNKTSESKLKLLQFFGLDLRLFGGPSQPEPTDERGGIQRARRDAEADDTMANLNQYENDLNWGSHMRWTGPQILAQLPSISVLCAGMGTAGTLTGTATYLKRAKPSVATVGVCTSPGDRVPGPRSHALLAPVKFPYKACVDEIVECGSEDAFKTSLYLTRNGLICGPSSGFNLVGLIRYLEKRKVEGTLEQLRGDTGRIECVFLCCDLPYQYLDEYFEKVPKADFPPIRGANLAKVDMYRYEEGWELKPQSAALVNACSRDDSILVDLRATSDIGPLSYPKTGHTLRIPMRTLQRDQTSPFHDSQILEQQWKELADCFDRKTSPYAEHLDVLQGKTAVIICYNGDTAWMATSILRANGVIAWSIKGGAHAWADQQNIPSPVDSPQRP
ncbi:uncharacterized protein N0V89_000167 [Didymosphaeria variabile]|uniref:Rhodanese domain-containing protein n=1 Tax=Didymosphaeria variabile TaxID=1932322 RepID=A0A9W9CFH0_9PLEO|nr:uncharacterized protein N0V89_000167 [Didymosphaeria variabile]KAJ4359612.1 hypothetical protein N0V89_000167 [Didymosphaeria variabile]